MHGVEAIYNLIRRILVLALRLQMVNRSLPTHQFFGKPKFILTWSTQLHLILIRIANMPAHEINLNPFKDRIISWFHNDMSSKEISERLANDHNIVCTDRTIERRLKIWGVKKRSRVLETAALRLRIVTMFFINFPNPIIMHTLN